MTLRTATLLALSMLLMDGPVSMVLADEQAVEGSRFALPAAQQERVNQAIKRGVEFIDGKRLSGGGGVPASSRDCALVGWTLAVHGNLDSAKNYLSRLLSDPRWTADPQVCALVLLLAAELEQLRDKRVARALTALKAAQSSSGLWAYDSRGVDSPNLVVTVWAALALHATGDRKRTGESLGRLAIFLSKRQGSDGRWAYGGSGRAPKPYHQGAFMGLCALAAAQAGAHEVNNERAVKAIRRALGRGRVALREAVPAFLRWFETDESDRKTESISWPYHSLLMLNFCCARQAGVEIDDTKWYARSARALVARQSEAGYWTSIDVPLRVATRVRRTCLALLCLRPADPKKPSVGAAPSSGD